MRRFIDSLLAIPPSGDCMLDAISWANGTAQDNQDSPQVTEQMDQDEQPFEVPPEELDQLFDQIKSAN